MTDQEIRLKFGEMNAGEMRLARALVAWHEREITKLKEDLTHAERWRDKLDTKLTEVVEAAERAGWDSVENSKNLPTFITYLAEALSKAQAELAALRTPILSDDGRSLGQVAMQAVFDADTEGFTIDQCYDAAAKAVAAVVLAQAVRRMEAVTVEELLNTWWEHDSISDEPAMTAVRARLIAAARGEGQDKEVPQAEAKNEPATFEALGKTWTRHTPGDPMPCDGGRRVFCISNSPDCYDGAMEAKCWSWGVETVSIIGWRYADEPEPAEPWTPAVGDTVRLKSGGPVMTVTHVDSLSLMCAWMNANNELQVEPITTLCLTSAQP